MAFFDKYPYTDFHELNLDWVLRKLKYIMKRIQYLMNAIDFDDEANNTRYSKDYSAGDCIWWNGEYYRLNTDVSAGDVIQAKDLDLISVADLLDEETAARKAADEQLQDNIDAEEAARKAADETLQNNIDAEEAARIAADNAEAAAREAADNAEKAARDAADTTLQNNIDSEASTRESADNNLQSQITSNDSDITDLQSRISTAETTITTNTTDITNLTTQVTTNTTNITQEISDRTSADENLQTQIDALSGGSSGVTKHETVLTFSSTDTVGTVADTLFSALYNISGHGTIPIEVSLYGAYHGHITRLGPEGTNCITFYHYYYGEPTEAESSYLRLYSGSIVQQYYDSGASVSNVYYTTLTNLSTFQPTTTGAYNITITYYA